MKLISHNIFLKHDLKGHPENADRIKQVLKTFKFENATNGEKFLNLAHTDHYINIVKQSSEHMKTSKEQIFLDAGETYVTPDTYKAACYAVGATIQAADYALKKQNSFAIVRPPGHHAHPDWTNGFCVFNNTAIAAAYLAKKGKRTLIVDLDIHRGDGTSNCVHNHNKELSKDIFYFSINQQGLFPGVSIDEGNIVNVYVEPNTSEDKYIEILKANLINIINSFKPNIIALSIGFDSFEIDRIKFNKILGCNLHLTKKSIDKFKEVIHPIPFFAVLEGGYDPDGILQGVADFANKKINKQIKTKNTIMPKEPHNMTVKILHPKASKRKEGIKTKKKSVKKPIKKKPTKKPTTKKKAVKKKATTKKSNREKKTAKKKETKKKAVKKKATTKKSNREKKTVKKKTTKKKR